MGIAGFTGAGVMFYCLLSSRAQRIPGGGRHYISAMIAPALVFLLLLAPPPPAELERTDQLIESVTAMKAKVAALQNEIDNLLRTLSEQRGALQRGPQPFSYLSTAEGDAKEAKQRCAANTSAGKRCTRPAEAGSRYCWQHQMAHAK
jgi:hypothetical protein